MINKAVELYLQMCGKPYMGYNYIRDAQPGELCWEIKIFNWDLVLGRFQTVTLKENILVLEIWDETTDDRIPEFSETVSSDISLEALHLKLRNAAKIESTTVLKRFLIDYYKANLNDVIQRLSDQQQVIMRFTVDSAKAKIAELELFCKNDAGINDVVQYLEQKINDDIDSLEEAFRTLSS